MREQIIAELCAAGYTVTARKYGRGYAVEAIDRFNGRFVARDGDVLRALLRLAIKCKLDTGDLLNADKPSNGDGSV